MVFMSFYSIIGHCSFRTSHNLLELLLISYFAEPISKSLYLSTSQRVYNPNYRRRSLFDVLWISALRLRGYRL